MAASDPARRAAVITPSNTVNFETPTRGIYVGGAGDVSVLTAGDDAGIVFASVPAGTVLPVAAKRVNVTGTDATDLVGLW